MGLDGGLDRVEPLGPDKGRGLGGIVAGEMAVKAGGGFGVFEFGVLSKSKFTVKVFNPIPLSLLS